MCFKRLLAQTNVPTLKRLSYRPNERFFLHSKDSHSDLDDDLLLPFYHALEASPRVRRGGVPVLVNGCLFMYASSEQAADELGEREIRKYYL